MKVIIITVFIPGVFYQWHFMESQAAPSNNNESHFTESVRICEREYSSHAVYNTAGRQVCVQQDIVSEGIDHDDENDTEMRPEPSNRDPNEKSVYIPTKTTIIRSKQSTETRFLWSISVGFR